MRPFGTQVHIKGWKMKDGKLVPCRKHKDVSARIRESSSKRVRVAKRGER